MDIEKRNYDNYNRIIIGSDSYTTDIHNIVNTQIQNVIVTKFLGITKRHDYMYECRCVYCNRILYLRYDRIKNTKSKLCDCQRKYNFRTSDPDIKPLYRKWNHMRQRCNNPNDIGYQNYGGRGIKVCEEWDNLETGFINFYNWALSTGWTIDTKLSIDRIDVNKGYSPDNCRWVNKRTQNSNRTNNYFIQVNTYIFPINIWAELTGLMYQTLYCRIYYYDWSYEEALFINSKLNKDNLIIPEKYQIYNKYQEFIDNGIIDPIDENENKLVIRDFRSLKRS